MLRGVDEKIEGEKREMVDVTELTEEEIERQIKRLRKKEKIRCQMRHGSTIKGTREEN